MEKQYNKTQVLETAKTQIKSPKFREELLEVAKHETRKSNKLKAVGGVLAGGAGIAGLMSFTPAPIKGEDPIPLYESPELAKSVNDQMGFSEAFASAREELGAGGYFLWHGKPFSTYYKEEWEKLTTEEQNEFYQNVMDTQEAWPVREEVLPEAITIYETAPEATHVNSSMSFNDAFSLAREEVGSGGVFQWNGKLYSTYTKEEWEAMDAGDKLAFQNSVDSSGLTEHELICNHEGKHTYPIVDFSDGQLSELFLGNQVLEVSDGEYITIGTFSQNGEIFYKVDADNNGTFDYLYDADLNQFYSLSTGEVILVDEEESAVTTPTPLGTETIMLNGHEATVTTFSDGSIEANVDFDDDGYYESILQIDTEGKMQIYDNDGNLVHEQMGENLFYQDSSEPGYLLVNDSEQVDDGHDEIDPDFNNDTDTGEWTI